jgi:sulfur carrier protein ThiS
VFQRGEGRENEIKAFGHEKMTLAALFATTDWEQENVVFEFDGEEYPSQGFKVQLILKLQ